MTPVALAEPECLITEICELFGLTRRAIRLYEEKGLVRPRRDAVNRRLYGEESRARLQLIAPLRRAGLSIDEIRYLLGPLDEPPSEQRRRQIADAIRARLDDLQTQVRQARAVLGDILAQAGDRTDLVAPRLRRIA
jgi:DNA-binding transcriptional MerR regulator